MTQHITAAVENGLLRPSVPLQWPEGTRVDLTVASTETEPAQGIPQSVRDQIAEIIAMPIESKDPDPYTSRDHDQYLYGAPRRT
jgi:predicted DNA-binding antitoxin AbrB/MazE fold protein